jgi:hypothetical protein
MLLKEIEKQLLILFCLCFCEEDKEFWEFLGLVVGGLTILFPKQLYLQWFKVQINNLCGQSTYVC